MSEKSTPTLRKFDYLKVIQGHYGQGWEDVDTDVDTPEGRHRIRENLRLYRENEPQYPHRLISRRARIDAEGASDAE